MRAKYVVEHDVDDDRILVVFKTVYKGLEKRLKESDIRGRSDNLQTIGLLKLNRILRRVLDTWGEILSLRLQWKITSYSLSENTQGTN